MTFCSLITKVPQIIPPGGYTALRFDEESTDTSNWHANQDLQSPLSALIIPQVTAVGLVSALVFWANDLSPAEDAATQYLHRFSRDPYDPELIDSTCTNDRGVTPGAEFHSFSWPMTVRTGQPLALMVAHNSSVAQTVTLAEFKVWVP